MRKKPDIFQFDILQTLDSIPTQEWNALSSDNNPFLKHEFLSALERQRCLGETVGWFPSHCIARNQQGLLVAAMPAYIKLNSFGEFVFDWAWASAYEQAGLPYYPKLVSAIPFTPASGSRLLLHPDVQNNNFESDSGASLKEQMLSFLRQFTESQQLSGIHCLFPNREDMDFLVTQGYLKRLSYQYHWNNNNHQNFDHYLESFKSRKRKKLRREREHVKEAGIDISIKHGDELSEQQWQQVFQFYQSTFHNKGNHPSLTLGFFHDISRTMGNQIVVVLARHQSELVAAAINLKSDTTLYGRYWGCNTKFNSLHFELCFYQGIEYCIKNKLQCFEPGAQGEHKITRGFLPTETWSAHWIAHPQFRTAITQFLQRETTALHDYKKELDALSPFRED